MISRQAPHVAPRVVLPAAREKRIRATMVRSRGKQTIVVPATDSVHGSWKHTWRFPGEEISDQRRRVIDRSVEQRDPFTRSP